MDFETLLTQLETQRPDLSGSLSLLRNYHRNHQEKEDDGAPDPEKVRYLETLLEKQKAINRRLHDRYESLKGNYGQLLSNLDELACAIGACPHCWGEEPDCGHCRGRGVPGYFFPDHALFEKYVNPVILKVRIKS